jgi:hypothetical protein
VHAYIIDGFKKVPLLINFERVPKALLITHTIDIEVTNGIQGSNNKTRSKQDKIDRKHRNLHFNLMPII